MQGAGWRAEQIEEVPARDPSLGPAWHSIRHHFDIVAFGVNANEADAGVELVELHDELEDDQEELFVVVRGRARFTCDGVDAELGPGGMLYARPEVRRSATALEPSTLLVMIGGKRGQAYAVPDWDRDQPATAP